LKYKPIPELSEEDIGKKFDVSGVLVSKIKKREIWKHVA
jgi:hypothetical protein